MTRIRTESSWISRLWAAVTEASSAAVAIHYAAPWERPTAI
ncbi:hypothetical protein [Sphingopyxis sp.]|jgi:hypothetical protein